MPRRCLIYAHWDADGFVDPFVVHALRSYRGAVDHVVFVSTGYDRRCPAVEDLADRVIRRPNVGFDFASWQAGLESVGVADYDEVLFTNSSVYGPLWPLEQVFATSAIQGADLWGMSISLQHGAHLQSYFMAMPRATLESPVGRGLWAEVRPWRRKTEVIEAYELRWLARCEAHGLRVRALYDARCAADTIPFAEWAANAYRWHGGRGEGRRYRQLAGRGHHNPTHLHWQRVLEARVPLLKVDLLTLNPCGLRLSRLRRWLERHTSYPLDLIDDHVERTRRRRLVA